MEYEAIIGLETHVQLKTKSKMWCGCANAFGSEPNTNVCPVCLGLPGVLPVPNEEALRLTVLTGLLLNCAIPRFAKFDRKKKLFLPGHAEELPAHAIRPAVHGQRLGGV
jgi:aspartyl-tRNA(Asn)/glutamyl-tRNA(Gln) amidotransferase subunit B